MTITVEEHAIQLFPDLNQTQLAAGPFLVKTPALSPYHHQLWLLATLQLEHRKGGPN